MSRILGLLGVLGIAVLAGAATLSAQPASPSFGVDSETSVVVTAWDMQAANSGTTWQDDATSFRYPTNTTFGGVFLGGVPLPNGALITKIELEACDASIEGEVTASLYRNGSANILATVSTGVVEVPGCARFPVDLAVQETVDNLANRYLVSVAVTAADSTATIGAVRVFYKLQVSPAPAVATFTDVPTDHPFFQYIEALAASGITGGCGTGIYCPDNPLTRGQMAVFLAKALGLHWPN